MRRHVAFVLAVCLFANLVTLSVHAKDPAAKQPEKPSTAKSVDAAIAEFVIGEPVHYKNLTIFPVASKAPKNEDKYLTLEEGLKTGLVQVFERGAVARSAQAAVPGSFTSQGRQESAEVNSLMVSNGSGKPLYLMPGEILYGGQQDRTIAVETIIPPGKPPVAIDVYCVEHGRWSNRNQGETVTALASLAPVSGQPADTETQKKMAEEAAQGKFVAQAGVISKDGRAAVQDRKGQQAVWDKVGDANSASGARSESHAFTANYTDPKMKKELDSYIDAAQTPVAKQSQVVGAIVAVNGTVESVDIFQSTPLFVKLWPKLLKGHALDAFSSASKPGADKTCNVNDAQAFLRDAVGASVAGTKNGQGGLVVTKRESKDVMCFSACPAASPGMGGGMGRMSAREADIDNSVHSSAYKK